MVLDSQLNKAQTVVCDSVVYAAIDFIKQRRLEYILIVFLVLLFVHLKFVKQNKI